MLTVAVEAGGRRVIAAASLVLLDGLRRRQPMLAGLNVAVAGVVVVVFWQGGAVAAPVLAAWFGAMVLSQAARLLLLRRRVRSSVLRRRMTAVSGVAGILWGVGSVALYVQEPVIYQVFLPFVLTGMIAGATIALPLHLPAFYAFYLPALLPYALCLMLDPSPPHRVMAGMALLLALGVGVIGYLTHAAMAAAARTRAENSALVFRLRAAQADLERRVERRTNDLRAVNAALNAEISKRRRTEMRIRHLLHHDPLTNLPNRMLFEDRLRQALAHGRRSGERLAVLMFDLDGFKAVNDAYGHPVGDRLLRLAAERLRRIMRDSDTVARFGGDEFAILQLDLLDAGGAAALGRKVANALRTPFTVDGRVVRTGASIGIALFPKDGDTPLRLIERADRALYRAKRDGRGGFRFADDDAADAAASGLDGELERALAAQQFELHYQPRFTLAGRRLVGVEALLRWRHPRRGLLAPAAFLGTCEANGLIRPLGRWVLATACRQGATWRNNGLPVPVAVNLSPVQLDDRGFAEAVTTSLARSGLPPRLLELEVSERLSAEAGRRAASATIDRLAASGVGMVLEARGAADSTLAGLHAWPLSAFKLDRALLHGNGSALARALTALGHGLQRRVVATGVETPRDLATAHELSCDEVQGYLLGRPCSVAEITARLPREHLAACP